MATLTFGGTRITQSGSWRERLVVSSCLLVVAASTLGDVLTDRDIAFTGVAVIGVVLAALLVDVRACALVTTSAWLGQALGVAAGAISVEAAAVNAASTALAATVLPLVALPAPRAHGLAAGEAQDGTLAVVRGEAPVGAPGGGAAGDVCAGLASAEGLDAPAAPPASTVVYVLASAPAPVTLLTAHHPSNPTVEVLRARGLTPRECEVVGLALSGFTADQIGRRLFIGRRTVETHLARAYSKFGVHSRAEIAEELFTHGEAAHRHWREEAPTP